MNEHRMGGSIELVIHSILFLFRRATRLLLALYLFLLQIHVKEYTFSVHLIEIEAGFVEVLEHA